MLGGIIISVVLYVQTWRREESQLRLRFAQSAEDRISQFKAQVAENIEGLGWLSDFYGSSKEVERAEFRSFSRSYLRDNPEIKALCWVPKVDSRSRGAFEAAAKAEGLASFEIFERNTQGNKVRAAGRDEYFPVYYVEPYKNNESVLGFDLGSEVVWREALSRCGDDGGVVAVSLRGLGWGKNDEYVLLVLEPIYQNGVSTDSVEQRRENIKGFGLEVFGIGDVLEDALGKLQPRGVDIYVYDVTEPERKELLCFHASRLHKERKLTPGYTERGNIGKLSYAGMFNVADRKWQIRCVAAPEFVEAEKAKWLWIIPVSGLGFTGLASVYVLLLLARGAREDRFSAELLAAKRRLEKEVSERKQVEKKIVALAKFPDENPNPVLRISGNGAVLYGNKASSSLLDFWQCGDSECSQGKCFGYVREVLASGATKQVEVKCDGRVFSLTFAPVCEFDYVNVYALDITGRWMVEKMLEKKVREMNCLYSLSKLAEQPEVSLERIFGEAAGLIRNACQYPEATCVRITFDGVKYETENFEKSETGQYRTIKAGGVEAGSVEVYYRVGKRRESGLESFAMDSDYLLDTVGEHLGRIAQLRKTREKLKLFHSLIDRSNDSIFIIESRWGRFLDINDRVCKTLGYTREELLGMSVKDVEERLPDEPSWQHHIEEIKRKGEVIMEGQHRTKDGRKLPVEVALRFVGQQDRDYIIAIARDITERKRAEQKQSQLLQDLQKANQELTDFAYVVSHDLKAPLRGIETLADWISNDYKEKLGCEGKEQMELLTRRVERMRNLIDGILQYSRVGRTQEPKVEIDLNKLVSEVIDTVNVPSNIVVTIEDTLPVIRCEQTRIVQVFQNLLSNAVKYMDKAEGWIKVGCVEDEEFWRFSVSDNGPGIEEKYFDKIFKMFQTLTRRDEFESTGVGLTVVKKIVELYGGEIWVESEVNNGSTFFFTLPKERLGVIDDAKHEASVTC